MVGGIAAIVVSILFYLAAEKRGLPVFHWAFAGLISYYIPNFIWSLTIAKPWNNELHRTGSVVSAGLVGHSSVLVGLVVAALVYFIVLRRKSA